MVHTLNQGEMGQELPPSLKAKKFILWLFVVSSTIMFGGFTSFYIVFAASKGKGHGLVLPDVFMYSTAVLVLSSICLFLGAKAVRNQNLQLQKIFLSATLILGLVFGWFQIDAWSALYQTGATLVNNNAAISLIYIVSGMHLLHIVAGLIFIAISLYGAFTNVPAQKAVYRIEIASIFWHFIDILWIYLYVFLLLNS
ncbi:cytochrome c oxidase subunit 3 [Pedobacter sp. MC2016-15]|jgi:cytochrome c oxidase subunit 3|uniref:cytochrome c oxidase subunit 3 n=1 Tax=Pedobacter sp. MC2016-15 TaxID=2994473 RepID=UPI0022457714|nr:cytochrome c oxidase subunit 3 [Pedobacter sp. MC2016-15]MCX2478783.1 cytochrome c oxidase subunit 3 [Pedobacter sp. MC2016-15]